MNNTTSCIRLFEEPVDQEQRAFGNPHGGDRRTDRYRLEDSSVEPKKHLHPFHNFIHWLQKKFNRNRIAYSGNLHRIYPCHIQPGAAEQPGRADHVEQHLKRRRRGVAWSGFCYRLGKVESAGLDIPAVMRGDYLSMPSRSEIAKLRKLALKSRLYSWIRHPTKPRLFGGNIGVWRSDYERVNGYDENFVGWGGEDDDLRMRLRRSGVRIHSILPWTRTYHLWHRPVDSAPASIMDGDNIPYLHRPKRLTRCLNGLVRREATDLRVRLSGDASRISSTLHGPLSISDLKLVDDRAEVELALASATFLDKTAWKILVLPPGVSPNAQSLKIADMIVTDDPSSHGIEPERAHGLGELETALRRVA